MKSLPFLMSAAAVILAGAASAVAATAESALPRFPLYERYIAIDGSCGWPLLITLANRDIACYIWPDTSHGYSEGAVECWVSQDQGRTWQRRSVPVPNEPTTNRMNHAGGLAADGSLIALVSGWDNRKPKGWMPDPSDKSRPLTHFAGAHTRRARPAISTDSGLTWKQFPEVTDPEDADRRPTAYGRVQSLPDGQLGVMLYSAVVDFYTSADGGMTWQKRGRVSGEGHNETTWIRLANGDLFAASRTGETNDAFMLLQGYRSKDNGATWTLEHNLTLPRQHPADLTGLPDGRILLTYGVRNEGNWSIAYRVGDAEARNWSPPVELVDLEGSTDQRSDPFPIRDGGYPSTVVMPDGVLVTAYYTRGVMAHHRYHVGVVRWKIPPP
ncbi:MAG: hypothetical protein JWM88_437 [Verrucomicrobia bacterium]|nr:hypothetical protein [Verrucomicrobiota bacterium]